MHGIARAFVVALVLLAACSSNDAGTTTVAVDGSGTEVTVVDPSTTTSTVSTTTSPTGSTTTSTVLGSVPSSSSSSSTSTTKPSPTTTKPTATIPPSSTPVTDDSTPGGGTRPANAQEVTVTSTQLFVIGGDTLYLVVEGAKVGKCQRLDYITQVTGTKIEIDLFSVPDAGFCTPSTDYKDSLALGVYGPGSYKIFLKGNQVASVDLV